jgi:hypothetical protein
MSSAAWVSGVTPDRVKRGLTRLSDWVAQRVDPDLVSRERWTENVRQRAIAARRDSERLQDSYADLGRRLRGHR